MTGQLSNSFIKDLYAIQHIVASPVMMANAEAALVIDTPDNYKDCLQFQKDGLVELSNIMNTMLDISKKENHLIGSDSIRIDELLFDCVDEVSLQNSQAIFDLKIDQSIEKSERLTINGNSRMLKMAFCNLLKNAVNYSATQKVSIEIMPLNNHVQVSITNDGSTISMGETEYLFKQTFRGANAKTKGFGIGLILANRIVALHNGVIKYMVTEEGLNCFSTRFQLFG